jgi:hypothetical protein
MQLLNILIPCSLMIFIRFKLNKNILAICAIPIILSLGETVFIRTWNVQIYIPIYPYPLEWKGIVFISLIISCLYILQKRQIYKSFKIGFDFIVVFLLLFLMILQLPISWIKDGSFKPGIIVSVIQYCYLPLSIILWTDILRRVSRSEAIQLINIISIITIPLAFMYTLSSVGYNIFPYMGWDPVSFGSAIIARDFLTFPVWTKLALANYLSKSKQNLFVFVSIGILLLSILLSYTRSWIIPAIIMIIILIIYSIFINKKISTKIRQIIVILAIFSIVYILISILLPDNLKFIFNRFNEVKGNGLNIQNIISRKDTFTDIGIFINNIDKIFGVGFTGKNINDVDKISQDMFIGDVLYATILLWFGWSGVVAYILLFVTFIVLSFKLTIDKNNENVSRLGLMLFMILIWDFIRSFLSAEYILLYPVANGFVYALIMVENRKLWLEKPINYIGFSSLFNINNLTFKNNFIYKIIQISILLMICIYIGKLISR